jgi:hypothetical protein
LSAHDVADVPTGVVTVTSTVVLAVPAGDIAVILVSLTTVKLVAGFEPNFTAVAPIKPEPVMVTEVPPDVWPDCGEIPVTCGEAAAYVNLSAGDVADVPPEVVTVTSTIPVPAGDFAVILVVLTIFTSVAGVMPNFTVVPVPKLFPVMVTVVPPAVEPEVGEMPVTVGAAAVYVNLSTSVFAEVPAGVVTVTSSVPVPAGDIAVIWVGLSTVKLVAAV